MLISDCGTLEWTLGKSEDMALRNLTYPIPLYPQGSQKSPIWQESAFVLDIWKDGAVVAFPPQDCKTAGILLCADSTVRCQAEVIQVTMGLMRERETVPQVSCSVSTRSAVIGTSMVMEWWELDKQEFIGLGIVSGYCLTNLEDLSGDGKLLLKKC